MNFSFLNPAALWILPISLLPVALHLFFRRPPKTVLFGDLKLLAGIVQKTKPLKKIRQWLILLLRVLALFCLFFFFAKPVLHWGSASGVGDYAALALLIDRSYSMQARAGGISLFEQAQRDAEKVLASLNEADRSSVIAFSDQIDYDSGALTNRHPDLLAAVKTLKPGYGNTAILGALHQAYQTLANSPAANKCILILSDNALHGWSGISGQDSPEGWAPLIPNYDPSVKIALLTPAKGAQNVSLESVETLTDVHSGLMKYRLDVQNWGNAPVRHLPVYVESDAGQKVTETLTDLAPRERKTIFLSAPPSEKSIAVKANIRADSLEVDDSFFWVQSPLRKIRVLVAEDHAGSGAISGDSYFLRQALRSGPSPFEVQTVTLGQIHKLPLRDYQALVLINPSEIEGEPAEAIRRFSKSGGSVWLTLGERYQAGSLDSLQDILPAQLQDKMEIQAQTLKPSLNLDQERLNLKDYDLQKIEVRKAVRSSLKPQSKGWFYFEDGTPLLIFSGDQKTAVWTSSIDRSWNNLASKPLFVPLAREVMEALTESQKNSQLNNLWIGDSYRRDFSSPVRAGALAFEGEMAEAPALHFKENSVYSDPFKTTGLYRLMDKSQAKPLEDLAVNADRRRGESDLAPASSDFLSKVLPETQWIFLEAGEKMLEHFIKVLRGKDMTRTFAALAGVFLLCELAMVYRKK